LVTEDGVEDVVCLDVMCDSIEPLGIMVMDLNELFLTFEVESPQEFIVAPVVS
jgi:hypothetical protein